MNRFLSYKYLNKTLTIRVKNVFQISFYKTQFREKLNKMTIELRIIFIYLEF